MSFSPHCNRKPLFCPHVLLGAHARDGPGPPCLGHGLKDGPRPSNGLTWDEGWADLGLGLGWADLLLGSWL